MKIIFDIIISLIGILLFLPLLLIISILIKITSNGPIFFLQDRVGKDQIKFKIIKFRTMIDNAEQIGSSVTTADDQRITKIGKVLRRTKLDEFPQLFNVLKGDMSIVGPRPDVPEIIDGYTDEMKHIFRIRPGITSIASVILYNEESLLAKSLFPDEVYRDVIVPAKVDLAMKHVENASLFYDVKILLITILAFISKNKVNIIKDNPFLKDLELAVIQYRIK